MVGKKPTGESAISSRVDARAGGVPLPNAAHTDARTIEEPKVQGTIPAHEIRNASIEYDFAVNKQKLARAVQSVITLSPALDGAALIAAVKEKYVKLGGLLTEVLEARRGKAGLNTVVNVADKN